MVQSIFTFLRLFMQTLRGADSPRQLAWGVTLGLFIGLIPDSSLLVPLGITIVLATYANLFTAACSAIGWSWLGFALDSWLDRLGGQILTLPPLQPVFVWASEAPLLPWTRFNNTIVAGATLLAIALAYPTYTLSEAAFRILAPRIHRKLIAYRIYRYLTAVPAAPDQSSEGTPS